MKYQALFFIALVATGHVIAGIPVRRQQHLQPKVVSVQQRAFFPSQNAQPVGIDFCPVCVQFAGESLNYLLNMILNGVVIGSCGALCQELENKVNSSIIGVVCNLLCAYVGIEAFIKIIEKADLDPIYYCELVDACPVKDDGDATIKNVNVIPHSFAQGARFKIEVIFATTNGTGTGELVVEIQTVDHIPVETSELITGLQPGVYNMTFDASASDNGCDPSQDICEEWLPGNYTVMIEICNGSCGSKHPHSSVYDQGQGDFVITGNN